MNVIEAADLVLQKPTDKELTETIKATILAASKAVYAARYAGLSVVFDDDLLEQIGRERPDFTRVVSVTRKFL